MTNKEIIDEAQDITFQTCINLCQSMLLMPNESEDYRHGVTTCMLTIAFAQAEMRKRNKTSDDSHNPLQ